MSRRAAGAIRRSRGRMGRCPPSASPSICPSNRCSPRRSQPSPSPTGGGGLLYEPKWDGFRGIVALDGDDVEIGSRGGKPLTRYFPELVEAFAAALPRPVRRSTARSSCRPASPARSGSTGRRCRSASTRPRRGSRSSRPRPRLVRRLRPARARRRSLLDRPFGERRAALEALLADAQRAAVPDPDTDDADVAQRVARPSSRARASTASSRSRSTRRTRRASARC